MAQHLRKSFKDSLNDIKERMKEKRNQKLTKLGKTSQISAVRCKITTSRSKQMKSIQANNKALAQALQEEKLKLMDAEATILQLRKEYHDLKVQMFDLQRDLRLKQEQGLVENRLSALNKIISKVSQNLLDSVDLLGPAKNLCSIGMNQRALASVLGSCSSVTGQMCSVKTSLQGADGDDQVLPSGMEADNDRNEWGRSVSEICEESDSAISLIGIVSGKEGRTSDFHLDNIGAELENVSSSGEAGFDNMLPKRVPITHCYSKMRNRNELCTGILDHSGAPDSTEKFSELDEIGLEQSLEEHAVENITSDISQLNENKLGSELVLRQTNSETSQLNFNSNSDLKQSEFKSREDAPVRKEKHQKGKLEWPKNTSCQKGKKRQSKEASKENLDFLGGSSDAYDFNFEECVHLTPFRQNKVNDRDAGVADNVNLSETNTTESSSIEEDSDDSLYEPYNRKSKKGKSSMDKKDTSPVHVRPRSKRCLAQREQKIHNEKEAESNKSSGKSITEPSEPSRHLRDVTNITSVLPSTGNATIVPEAEGPQSPKCKRSCTATVNYKEPSITGKLRRGDPFTDASFLDSPIFKKKKNAKCPSLKKASLSKYNKKFVGCCGDFQS